MPVLRDLGGRSHDLRARERLPSAIRNRRGEMGLEQHVLLRVYASCVEEADEIALRRIEGALK